MKKPIGYYIGTACAVVILCTILGCLIIGAIKLLSWLWII